MPKGLAAVASVATNVAAIVNGIKAVVDFMDTAQRSAVITIKNFTDLELSRVRDNHQHGNWAVPPDTKVPAKTAQTFGSQSKAFSIGTGTEGSIAYDCGRFEMVIYWNNPFIGDNACSAYLAHKAGPPDMAFYRTVHTCGAGNKGAQFAYELLGIQDYPTGTDHFYTTSANERDGANNNYGYISEGIACYVHTQQAPNTVPLYRFLNPQTGDHFYTISEQERAAVLNQFQDEGVACYVYPQQDPNTVPLFRLANLTTGDHFYTTSTVERTLALGWHQDEGVACFVYADQAANTVPLYRMFKVL